MIWFKCNRIRLNFNGTGFALIGVDLVLIEGELTLSWIDLVFSSNYRFNSRWNHFNRTYINFHMFFWYRNLIFSNWCWFRFYRNRVNSNWNWFSFRRFWFNSHRSCINSKIWSRNWRSWSYWFRNTNWSRNSSKSRFL